MVLMYSAEDAYKIIVDEMLFDPRGIRPKQRQESIPDRSPTPVQKEAEFAYNLLATFVPDIVIKFIRENKVDKLPYKSVFYGATLFADISGFTVLTEKYTFSGTNGIEELTKTLNNYIGPIVARIIAAGGDIFKFAGDAVFCLWPVQKKEDISAIIQNVLDCAFSIQEDYGIQETGFDVKLRIKFGISTGKLEMGLCGNPEKFIEPVILGAPIAAVQRAQNMCQAGEIIMTDRAWNSLKYKSMYEFVIIKKKFVKIVRRTSSEQIFTFASATGQERRAVIEKCTEEELASISRFVIPLLIGLESTKHLNYLAEVRQVTVVFVNLISVDIVTDYDIIVKAFDVVYSACVDMQGILNKTISFDKGCNFLVVFGLPGYKHQNDSARALLCAVKITKMLHSLDIKTSIGVTTATAFCGIVGNPFRQEYTVIGRGVNMAARLMIYYSEKAISCDDNTYFEAKEELGEHNFKLLPIKQLKGMQNVKALYEYSWETIRETIRKIEEFPHPILGVINERATITNCLKKTTEEKSEQDAGSLKPHHFIVIRSDSGMGKGRLLHWAAKEARDLKFNVVSCSAVLSMKDVEYAVISSIISQLLGLTGSTQERQAKFEEFLEMNAELKDEPYLCLLNDHLQLQFPFPKEPLPQNDSLRDDVKQQLITMIVTKVSRTRCAFAAIDDAHCMDDKSWSLLHICSEVCPFVVVVTIPGHYADNLSKSAATGRILLSGHITSIMIGPLDLKYTGVLACQLLNVVGIHKKIVTLLENHGKGNPRWVQELINFLNELGHIILISYVVTQKSRDMFNREFLFPLRCYLDEDICRKAWQFKESAVLQKGGQPVTSALTRGYGLSPEVCDIAEGCDLDKIKVPNSMQSLILQRLNILSVAERQLLKNAAVFGSEFDIPLLSTITPDVPKMKVKEILSYLLEYDILEVVGKEKSPSQLTDNTKLKIPDFISETVYNKMLLGYKLLLHNQISMCLEERGVVCESCEKGRDVVKNNAEHSLVDTGEELLFHDINIDLRSCTCQENWLTLCEQLAIHWSRAQKYGRAVHYLHEATVAALAKKDVEKASNSLKQVEKLFNKMSEKGSCLVSGNENDIDLALPVIYITSQRLSAEINFLLGNVDTSLSELKSALALLGRNFPVHYKKFQPQFLKQYQYRTKEEIFEESFCLGLASRACLKATNYSQAYELAKFHSELLKLKGGNFHDIVDASSLLINTYYMLHGRLSDKQPVIEEEIIKIVEERLLNASSIKIQELLSIGNLYKTILHLHLCGGDLDRAIEIGFKANKLFENVHDMKMLLHIRPLLSQAFLYSKNYPKAVEILTQLQSSAYVTKDKTGLALYYGNLAELLTHGDITFSGDRIQQCQEFAGISNPEMFCPSDEVEYYLAAYMTLWCMREGSDARVDEWHCKAINLQSKELEGFWAVSAHGCMIEITIEELHRKPAESFKELKARRKSIDKVTSILNFVANLIFVMIELLSCYFLKNASDNMLK